MTSSESNLFDSTVRQNAPHMEWARRSSITGGETLLMWSARAAATSSAVLLGRAILVSDAGKPTLLR